jgi:hypothetical protein
MPEQVQRTNRLLSLLSDQDYEQLRPHLSHVTLEYKKSLYEAFRPIEQVYFPRRIQAEPDLEHRSASLCPCAVQSGRAIGGMRSVA